MESLIKDLNKKFNDNIKKDVGIGAYNAWFAKASIKFIDGNKITFIFPSKLHVEYVKSQYEEVVLSNLKKILSSDDIEIEYLIDSKTTFDFNENTSSIQSETITDPTQEVKIENFDIYKKTQLNPKFTFDNFIQGNGNETAYASAITISKNLKNTPYNPLLIFGGVGLGKTHLIQAIGNYVFKNSLAKNILYIPSDQFVSEIVNNIKNNTMDSYKNYLRDKDLIIIDDIQFFARKEKSQQELFHIFNYIYNNNGQIVLTSDFHPNDIHELDERLKTRFKMGLITDVRPPDLETRAAIINLKIEQLNFSLTEEVVMFIANNINTNVRDLEGAVNTLYFKQNLSPNAVITIAVAKDILRGLITSKKTTLNIDKIQDIVSEYFNIPKDLLLKKNRTKEIAEARAYAMYLCTTQLKSTTVSIGANFGNREHSTVSHATKKIQTRLNKKDGETIKIINELLNLVNLSTY